VGLLVYVHAGSVIAGGVAKSWQIAQRDMATYQQSMYQVESLEILLEMRRKPWTRIACSL
jgi:hypothetical protein